MNKDTLIKVTNRSTGRVGYIIPELNVQRQFASKESKDIPYGELEALSYLPGGMPLLKDYLSVNSEAAINALELKVEPEYYYKEEDVKELLLHGSLDAFLDCLDFAPEGVLEMVKKLAVELPVNDVSKRKAILDKMNFDVTRAIEIQNMKYDGEEENAEAPVQGRRVAVKSETAAPAGRRVQAPKYNVIKSEK